MAEQQSDPTNEDRPVSEIRGTSSEGTPFSTHSHHEPKVASHAKLRFLAVAMVVIVSGSAGFFGGLLGSRNADDSQDVKKQQVILKTQGQLISNIAKDVGASVVSVEVTSTSEPTDSFFGFQGSTQQESAGTGIIIAKDGLILTNRHVVPIGTTNVNVTLSDGTKFTDVEVIGRTSSSDPLDIAFLKIKDTKGKTLSPATIGNSSSMKVGDPVVAIGNALGQFQNSVTSGIISGFGRSVQASDSSGSSSENLENLFQTDAAINEGNSGGPLVNLEGEVVGINTAVAGDAQNIGFAIPIDDVSGLISSVEQDGKLERPYLGVVFIPITADMSKQYDLGVDQGAYVPPSVMIGQDAVINGGPADKAGIKEGDIITKVGNDVVDDTHSLTSLLSKHKVGDKVAVTIYRDGKDRTVDVTLGVAPTE